MLAERQTVHARPLPLHSRSATIRSVVNRQVGVNRPHQTSHLVEHSQDESRETGEPDPPNSRHSSVRTISADGLGGESGSYTSAD